jgi:hypothetical protein
MTKRRMVQTSDRSHFLPVHALNRLGQRPTHRLVISLLPTGSIDDQSGESGPPSQQADENPGFHYRLHNEQLT